MNFERHVQKNLKPVTSIPVDEANRGLAWFGANSGKMSSLTDPRSHKMNLILHINQLSSFWKSDLDQENRTKLGTHIRGIIDATRGMSGEAIELDANQPKLGFDDPVAKWRMFDIAMAGSGDRLTGEVFGLVLKYCHNGDPETFYDGMDAIADLGSPPIPIQTCISRAAWARRMPGQELFIETIFRSHHMYHVEPEEIEATVEALVYSKAGSVKERVAVETLLRLDEYDRVPTERFQRWWDAEIIAADRVFRWDTVSMLTLHPGNRAMLIEQLPKAKPPLQRAITKNLRLRAESTLRTKRWDFMTEAECQTILALPTPPELGKDTEDGAALPFPEDE